MTITLLLLGLLAFAGFQMHLKDRARRDLMALASRLTESGQPLPPELMDKLLAEAGRLEIPRWIIALVLLLPVVPLAFTASAFDVGDYALAVRIGAGLAALSFVVAAGLVGLRPRAVA